MTLIFYDFRGKINSGLSLRDRILQSIRVKLYFIITICVIGVPSFAQNLDSLWTVYNNKSQTDTNRLNAIHAIAKSYVGNSPDTAIILAEQELKFAQTTKQKIYEGKALNIIGVSFNNKGNYPKALESYLKALKLFEEIGNKKWIGNCYINIGDIYTNQQDYSKALEYCLKSLKISEELGDKQIIGYCYTNIGVIYLNQSNSPKALEYFLKSLKISEEIGDKRGIGYCYSCIGAIYQNQSNYPKALEYFLKDLKIWKEIGNKKGIGTCYISLGGIYINLSDYKRAIQYCDSALQITKETGDVNTERNVYQNLATTYSKTGRYKEAYENYVTFKTLTDSVFNADKSKKINDLANNFETEKKDVEQAKLDAIALEQKKRQQFVIYGVAGMLLIVIVFSALLYKRFRLTNKQKQIIEIKSKETEEQKNLIEEKQNEIIDSITYAKRLQQAILPADAEIKKYLSESFIYYQPKDIVAGDFYWMEYLDGMTYIAAADSTGHGVPGAMVSVVCSNALNRAVKEFGLRNTGEILDKTRELVIETFEKSDKNVKDGMDISLMRIEMHSPVSSSPATGGKNSTKIQWSGANNSLWYFQNSELTEIKANKQPIGKYNNPVPFTTHSKEFTSSVSFYLFSDGYADQFSRTDKKLMTKKFKEVLLSIQHLPMQEQGKHLEKFHVDWKGNMEQTDDVLVIGLRV